MNKSFILSTTYEYPSVMNLVNLVSTEFEDKGIDVYKGFLSLVEWFDSGFKVAPSDEVKQIWSKQVQRIKFGIGARNLNNIESNTINLVKRDLIDKGWKDEQLNYQLMDDYLSIFVSNSDNHLVFINKMNLVNNNVDTIMRELKIHFKGLQHFESVYNPLTKEMVQYFIDCNLYQKFEIIIYMQKTIEKLREELHDTQSRDEQYYFKNSLVKFEPLFKTLKEDFKYFCDYNDKKATELEFYTKLKNFLDSQLDEIASIEPSEKPKVKISEDIDSI